MKINQLYGFCLLSIFSLWGITSLSQAIESQDAIYQQGIKLLEEKKYDAATTVLEQYIASDSTNAKAYYNLGLAYVNIEKYPQAVSAWKQAIALDPNFEQAHYNLGLLYIRPDAYHTQEAIAEFKIVLKLNPANYKAHYQLAFGYHRIGEYQNALTELDETLRLKPELPAAHSLKVTIYQTIQDYPAAIQEAEWIYKKDKTAQNKQMVIDLHLQYGLSLREQKKYEDALQQLSLAQKIEPNNIQVQYELAKTYAAMGRVQTATRLYEQVLQKDPNSPELLNNIADFYAEYGINLDRATLLSDSAIQLTPKNEPERLIPFLDTVGWIAYRRGNYASAYSQLSTALDSLLTPYQPDPHMSAADREAFLVNQPNYNAFPIVMQVRYHLAIVEWYRGNKPQCRELLDQIISAQTAEPAALDLQRKAKEWLSEKYDNQSILK